MLGQSYTIRAYCYFWLINMYQQPYEWNKDKLGIPIYLSLIHISCVAIPIKETTKVFAELGTFDNVNLPSMSVTAVSYTHLVYGYLFRVLKHIMQNSPFYIHQALLKYNRSR